MQQHQSFWEFDDSGMCCFWCQPET